jgi:membrane fusion protein (multidrug efflux system)
MIVSRINHDRMPVPREERTPTRKTPARRTIARWRRRWLFSGFGLIVLLAAVPYGIYYAAVGRHFVTTDDAYTPADAVAVSAQVPSYVAALLVTDNQPVRPGQVLLRIDERTYRAALNQR